ncbi:MAG: hypothetical protein IKS52_05365 [Clostridia bacterium]|nr:hypothetical protein [Clostridia bacterium]
MDMMQIMKNVNEAYLSTTDPALREARVLKCVYPAALLPMREEDDFACCRNHWTMNHIPFFFGTQRLNQLGYSVDRGAFARLVAEHPEAASFWDFWKEETTFRKIMDEAPKDVHDYLFPAGTGLDSDGYLRKGDGTRPLGAGFISGSFDSRVAGVTPDYDRLMRLGLDGLRDEIRRCQRDDRKNFYDALLMSVDIIADTCEYYRRQALDLAENAKDKGRRVSLLECAEGLKNIQSVPPRTLREGMQLMYVHARLAGVQDYGRMDEYFGDLLAADLAAGRLTHDSAVSLIMALWKALSMGGNPYNSRVLIGGTGRRNEKNADVFALAAIEATRRRHAQCTDGSDVMPVLTLRWSREQDPRLLSSAIQSIGEGCIYPTLYNDDVYVQACARIMHVPYEEALRYEPLGCGEILLIGDSTGSPNSTMRFLKALEATLHRGRDGADGVMIGIDTGALSDFDTYEKLEAALCRQIRAAFERDVKVHLWNRERSVREVACVMQSLLLNDCIERGLPLLDGGIRYFGANVEGFGLTNTADSLAAIKKLVYEEHAYTLEEVVTLLDANYEGHEEDRRRFLEVDKFGNNCAWVDGIKTRLEDFINRTADEICRAAGLHYYTVANVNPGGITIGPRVAASADGRKCGEPMAVGNSAMPGADKKGLAALLLSAAKTRPENGGVVTNLNLSRQTVCHDPEKIRALFETYFDLGGLQLNVNCFSRGDLERALERPDLYGNLIVRVSGYSARFIDLDKVTQKHIMERTLY